MADKCRALCTPFSSFHNTKMIAKYQYPDLEVQRLPRTHSDFCSRMSLRAHPTLGRKKGAVITDQKRQVLREADPESWEHTTKYI